MNIGRFIKSFYQQYKIEIFIFILALSLRLMFFYLAAAKANFIYEDLRADGYYEIAYNLVNHGIFSISRMELDSHRTPGLPFLIAPFLYAKSVLSFFILQIIVGGLLPVLGRRLAVLLDLPSKIATIVAVFLAVDPMGIKLSLVMLTETFFTLFFLLFIFFAARFIRSSSETQVNEHKIFKIAVYSGIFLGIATLFRPTTLYLPALLIMIWFLWRYLSKRKLLWRCVTIFLIAAWLLPAGWTYRNYRIFNVASYSSIKEGVLYAALAPSILAFKNNIDYTTAQNRFFTSEGLPGMPDIYIDQAADFQKKAMAVILANPKQFLEVAAVSVFTFFTHDGALDLLSLAGLNNGASASFPHGLSIFKQSAGQFFSMIGKILKTALSVVLLTRLVWFVVTIAFVFSLVYQIVNKRINAIALFFLICILYFALTTITNGLTVNARFRFPVNTLILIFAAQGVYLFWIQKRRVT